jgi:predicted oxidoreductase (fatty acid repression mutant protein)
MATRILRPASNLHTISRALGSTRTPQYLSAPRISPLRPFSSSYRKHTPHNTSDAFVQAAQARRTIYKLGKKSPVPDSKVEELVNAAILNVPSAFNTQSTRLVVVLREEHEKVWDLAIESFGGLVASGAVPEEVFKNQTLPKLQMFKAAYGTVCFPWPDRDQKISRQS